MKPLEIFRRTISRFTLFMTLVGIPLYMILLYFVILRSPFSNWSIVLAAATTIMLMGQFSIISRHSFAYGLYCFSCVVSIGFALFFWFNRNALFLEHYIITFIALTLVILILHIQTRKTLRVFPMFQVFSIFFFGLLIVLGTGEITQYSSNWLFGMTLLLFILVTIQGLNMAYRNVVLNKALKATNTEDLVGRCRDRLLVKFKNETSDIELLLHYFNSSLEHFVEGNFDSSFLDAYKIVFDGEGKAFHNIYVLPDAKGSVRSSSYARIRAILTHAKGRDANLPEIKQTRKKLFDTTLDLLKIVKFEFIEASLQENIK
jgi:hypothetical protein